MMPCCGKCYTDCDNEGYCTVDENTLEIVFDPTGLTDGVWQLSAENTGAGCTQPSSLILTVQEKMVASFLLSL